MCTPTDRPALTIVRVYFKSGFVRTLPFLASARPIRQSCAGHPAGQFLSWLRRITAVQPGFPTMIRAIFIWTQAPPCDVCQTTLTRVLSRYRLASRLRYAARPAERVHCSCGCQTSGPNGSPLTDHSGHDDRFGPLVGVRYETEAGRNPAGQLSEKDRNRQRRIARQQTRAWGYQQTPHRHTDHGIPLAQVHLDASASDSPNLRNLRFVTRRVHQAKEKMWNAYVMRTFFQRCTTPAERRQKLTDIYAELRKQYPNDMISHAFGREMELLDIR